MNANSLTAAPREQQLRLFPGESELARCLRGIDWEQTRLGPPARWSPSLRVSLASCLCSRFPVQLWWGPELTLLYNDAYAALLDRGQHPAALGRPGQGLWASSWNTMGPLVEAVRTTGVPCGFDDVPVFLDREVPREEVFLSFSLAPVLGEDGAVEGLQLTCVDTTVRRVALRRTETLRKLSVEAAEARSMADAVQAVAAVLRGASLDVPFAAVYLLDEATGEAQRAFTVGLPEDAAGLPATVTASEEAFPSPWPLAEVLKTHKSAERGGLASWSPALPGGAWPESATRALVLPIPAAAQDTLSGLLVAGLSPRRPLDRAYRTFFEQMAAQLGSALGDARAFEEERRRAEALAELDRAKTAFFADVSHEFRTPLSLILGPLEELLPLHRLTPQDQATLEVAHRNALRLLKLVSSLLDFSRIEAARVEAVYHPSDLETQRELRKLRTARHEDADREMLLASERAARSAAEQANRMKDEFLARISHELATPLFAMRMWLDSLSADEGNRGRGAPIAALRKCVQAQSNLILDLLDTARALTGKLRVNLEPCEPREPIEAAVAAIRAVAEQKGVTLECAMGETPLVQADPSRLQQVVANLLGNAVKFTPAGGRVEVRLEPEVTGLRIVVKDTGRGFPAEFKSLLFTPFRQEEEGTTRSAAGLGLGLAIVRQLVELHGGEVRAESAGRGKGATFTVWLPGLETEHPEAPEGSARARERQLEGTRVLLAEDDDLTRAAVTSVLEQHGAQVEPAGCAAAALKALEKTAFDVLLCDIAMPEEDGYSLIRKVRALESPAGRMPAAAFTAHMRDEDRVRALSAGFQMHIPKSIEAAQLIAQVRALIRN